MPSKKPVMSHDPLGDVPAIDASPDDDASPTSDGVVALPGSLTIADVGDYRATLQAGVAGAGALQFDGAGVEMIDGAGMQLLASAVKQALAQGRAVQWRAVSEALRRAASTLGMHAALGLRGPA